MIIYCSSHTQCRRALGNRSRGSVVTCSWHSWALRARWTSMWPSWCWSGVYWRRCRREGPSSYRGLRSRRSPSLAPFEGTRANHPTPHRGSDARVARLWVYWGTFGCVFRGGRPSRLVWWGRRWILGDRSRSAGNCWRSWRVWCDWATSYPSYRCAGTSTYRRRRLLAKG